eukprot:14094661-Alexandrium_andersonii.AAC.1
MSADGVDPVIDSDYRLANTRKGALKLILGLETCSDSLGRLFGPRVLRIPDCRWWLADWKIADGCNRGCPGHDRSSKHFSSRSSRGRFYACGCRRGHS